MTDIAIIGAGPYGLSLAAYLNNSGLTVRIFGSPMQSWLEHMPRGMMLKSDGFASDLYDPTSSFRLKRFCELNNTPYQEMDLPVALNTFTSYGQEFQHRLVPYLEQVNVLKVHQDGTTFKLDLANGETISARKVILATGIRFFDYTPAIYNPYLGSLASHTYDIGDIDRFKGKEIVVIGGGSSAIDSAAALIEAGAAVQLVARRHHIRFHNRPTGAPRPLLQRLRSPNSGLGPGWRSRFSSDAPHLFHRLPYDLRSYIVKKHLGPAPGWAVRDRIEGRLPWHLNSSVDKVTEQQGRIQLQVNTNGSSTTINADHILCGTGYRVELARLPYLNDNLRSKIQSREDVPILSSNFESSIPGLYFIGLAAANSFGPLLRFAYGAGFTSKHLSKHLIKQKP